jgi:hypothetical protein
MTDAEWLTCGRPQPMLEYLRGKVSERKMRLFAVACCRRFALLSAGLLDRALTIAEWYADGRIGEQARIAALTAVRNFGQDYDRDYETALTAAHLVGMDDESCELFDLCHIAALAVCAALETPVAGVAVVEHLHRLPAEEGVSRAEEEAAQAELIREIFGNPFREVCFERYWLWANEGTVRLMAQGCYDERAWDRLPILGDALEEAGCADSAILAHCRSYRQHARGSWVLDGILDKK